MYRKGSKTGFPSVHQQIRQNLIRLLAGTGLRPVSARQSLKGRQMSCGTRVNYGKGDDSDSRYRRKTKFIGTARSTIS
jgi:hypothetical protein